MSDLTEKFAALEAQIAEEHTATLAALAGLQTALDLVSSNTDLALENGAANTKALLAALGQTGACFPCPTPSIVVPPIGTTVNPIDQDHCKRAQAFLATIAAILTAMDTLQSFNVVGSFNVLNDAISEVVGALAGGESIPLPSFPETVNIVGDYVSYAGERVFSGVGLMDQFGPIQNDLRDAIYNQTTPEGAQGAYNAAIEVSGVSNGARLLFEAVAYSALYNYFYNPDSTPDLSGYDGTVCSLMPGVCFDFDLVSTTFNVGGTFGASGVPIGPFEPIGEITTTSGPYTSDPPAFFTFDLYGYHIYHESGGTVSISHRGEGPTSSAMLFADSFSGDSGSPTLVTFHTGTFFFFGDAGVHVWVCTPEE